MEKLSKLKSDMSFVIRQHKPRPDQVWLETDDVAMCVGQISLSLRRGWEFHFEGSANCLKPKRRSELKAFGDEQVTLRNIKDRMLT